MDAYGDTTTGDGFWSKYQCAANVVSKEQLDAYGDYDIACRALKMELYLMGSVGWDYSLAVVEVGHC